MKLLSFESLFGPLTGVRKQRESLLTLANAKWIELEDDTEFDGIQYAKGSKYKCWEGRDFGYVCFSTDSRTPDGEVPDRFLHKF